MLTYPCLMFKENRVVHSKEELKDRFEEASRIGKHCEVGIYGFSEWKNTQPILESVILDKIVYTGTEEELTAIAEKKLEEGYESILIHDGQQFMLFVFQELDDLEALQEMKRNGEHVIAEVTKKFTFPGYVNLKTGLVSKVIRRWKL